MKYIRLIIAAFLLAACSPKQETIDPGRYFTVQTLTHKAYLYYGLDEVNDRKVIKNIMGVDPVETQWCAAFVNMVLAREGLPTSASVSNYPLTARSFLKLGEEVKEPREGDIIIFPRGSQGWQGHVGFYVSTTYVDEVKYYNILGGNQSDSVNIEQYPARSVLGIRRIW